jgi:hypothetical protein
MFLKERLNILVSKSTADLIKHLDKPLKIQLALILHIKEPKDHLRLDPLIPLNLGPFPHLLIDENFHSFQFLYGNTIITKTKRPQHQINEILLTLDGVTGVYVQVVFFELVHVEGTAVRRTAQYG